MSDALARAAGMAAFDALPAPLRAALTRAAYPPDSIAVQRILNQLRWKGLPTALAVEVMVSEMPGAELIALDAFADQYRRRYGLELPHVAAGATLLRG